MSLSFESYSWFPSVQLIIMTFWNMAWFLRGRGGNYSSHLTLLKYVSADCLRPDLLHCSYFMLSVRKWEKIKRTFAIVQQSITVALLYVVTWCVPVHCRICLEPLSPVRLSQPGMMGGFCNQPFSFCLLNFLFTFYNWYYILNLPLEDPIFLNDRKYCPPGQLPFDNPKSASLAENMLSWKVVKCINPLIHFDTICLKQYNIHIREYWLKL